jgi:hypothetical protein
MDTDIVVRLREFMEHEARSCSMDPGCITPEYVWRMWGGSVPLEEIEKAMKTLKEEWR